MRPSHHLSFTALLILGSSALSAVPTTGWAPTTRWNVDYQPNQCRAGRNYAAGKAQASLGFEARPLKDSILVLVKIPRNTREISTQIKGDLTLGSHEERLENVTASPGLAGTTIYEFSVQRDAIDALQAGGLFKLRMPGLAVELPTNETAQLMKAMDECSADLLESWGLSREQQARMATPPLPIPGRKVFSNDDYPDGAKVWGRVGHVQAVVFVRADGTVGDCTIAVSSGHDDIDQATCRSIRKRAKFQPAVDKTGTPMDSPYVLDVNWAISKV